MLLFFGFKINSAHNFYCPLKYFSWGTNVLDHRVSFCGKLKIYITNNQSAFVSVLQPDCLKFQKDLKSMTEFWYWNQPLSSIMKRQHKTIKFCKAFHFYLKYKMSHIMKVHYHLTLEQDIASQFSIGNSVRELFRWREEKKN